MAEQPQGTPQVQASVPEVKEPDYKPGSTMYEMGFRTQEEYRVAQQMGTTYGAHEGNLVPKDSVIVSTQDTPAYTKGIPQRVTQSDVEKGGLSGIVTTKINQEEYQVPITATSEKGETATLLVSAKAIKEISGLSGENQFQRFQELGIIPEEAQFKGISGEGWSWSMPVVGEIGVTTVPVENTKREAAIAELEEYIVPIDLASALEKGVDYQLLLKAGYTQKELAAGEAKGVNLIAALRGGISRQTLLDAGFTSQQIADAQVERAKYPTTSEMKTPIPLDAFMAQYFREHDMEPPTYLGGRFNRAAATLERVIENDKMEAEASKTYRDKFGLGTFWKEVGADLPSKTLQIMPALWLVPGGAVLALISPVTKGYLGLEGWEGVSGWDYAMSAIAALDLTASIWMPQLGKLSNKVSNNQLNKLIKDVAEGKTIQIKETKILPTQDILERAKPIPVNVKKVATIPIDWRKLLPSTPKTKINWDSVKQALTAGEAASREEAYFKTALESFKQAAREIQSEKALEIAQQAARARAGMPSPSAPYISWQPVSKFTTWVAAPLSATWHPTNLGAITPPTPKTVILNSMMTTLKLNKQQVNGLQGLTQSQIKTIAESLNKSLSSVEKMAKSGELETVLTQPEVASKVLADASKQELSASQVVVLEEALSNMQSLGTTQAKTLTQILQANQELTKLQSLPKNETILQNITQLQNQIQELTQTLADTSTLTASQVETLTEILTPTITITPTIIEDIEAPPDKEKKIPPPPSVKLGKSEGEEEEKKRRRVPKGTIAFRMGMFWKCLPPPWEQNKLITLSRGVAPLGADVRGRTPQETLQVIGEPESEVPETISIDLGVTDAEIIGGGKVIRFAGGGQFTDVGDRIYSPTRGISIPSKGISRISRKTKRKIRSKDRFSDLVSVRGIRW